MIDILNEAQPENMPAQQNPLLWDLYNNKDQIDAMLKQEELKQMATRNRIDAARAMQAADAAAFEQAKAQSEHLEKIMTQAENIFKPALDEIAKSADNAEQFEEKWKQFLDRNDAYRNYWEHYVDSFSKLTGMEPDYVQGMNKRHWIANVATLGMAGPKTTEQSISIPGSPATGGLNQGGQGNGELSPAQQYLQNLQQ
jgi:acyl-CoA reductase-like NAD-dependent aldehyde dehydrogenase